MGGAVYTGENLSDTQIRRFVQVGGRWVCPWVYQDMNASTNLALIPHWRDLGVTVGGLFNCFGGDPVVDAANIAAIAKQHVIQLVILDCEGSYQYPNPGCALLPKLLAKLRELLPVSAGYEIGVNTNGLNDAMIWNGGQLGPKCSCNNLKIRVLPQWYSAPRYAGSCWADPVCNMKNDSLQKGLGNFHDPTQQYKRAVPLSYVHPFVEPTGVEGAVLEATLGQMVKAQQYGLTPGLCLFALERVPEPDFQLVGLYRGQLFQV